MTAMRTGAVLDGEALPRGPRVMACLWQLFGEEAALFKDKMNFTPHRSAPNLTQRTRRVLHVTYNRASEGDRRRQYEDEKRTSYPPGCEREPGGEYVFRV